MEGVGNGGGVLLVPPGFLKRRTDKLLLREPMSSSGQIIRIDGTESDLEGIRLA